MSRQDIKKGSSQNNQNIKETDYDTDDELAEINDGFTNIEIDEKLENIAQKREKSRGSSISITKSISKNNLGTSLGTSFSGTKRKESGLPNPDANFGIRPDYEIDIISPASSITTSDNTPTSPLLDNGNKRRK